MVEHFVENHQVEVEYVELAFQEVVVCFPLEQVEALVCLTIARESQLLHIVILDVRFQPHFFLIIVVL